MLQGKSLSILSMNPDLTVLCIDISKGGRIFLCFLRATQALATPLTFRDVATIQKTLQSLYYSFMLIVWINIPL